MYRSVKTCPIIILSCRIFLDKKRSRTRGCSCKPSLHSSSMVAAPISNSFSAVSSHPCAPPDGTHQLDRVGRCASTSSVAASQYCKSLALTGQSSSIAVNFPRTMLIAICAWRSRTSRKKRVDTRTSSQEFVTERHQPYQVVVASKLAETLVDAVLEIWIYRQCHAPAAAPT